MKIRDKGMEKEIFFFPASSAQQRLWFFDQLEPGSCTYNSPTAMYLSGPLDVTALEQGLNEIMQRHEILRTTFSVVEDQPVQVIAPTSNLTLPVVDLQELSEPEREREARRLTTEEAQRPFDLSRGPLIRARLLCLAEEEHILLLTMHHIVSDEWSMDILFRELSLLYEALTTGKPWSLPELPIQYADFAVWQRECLQGEILEAQLSYWREHLAGAPLVLELPTDRPRPGVQTYRGARESVVLSKAISESFKELSLQEGTTLFMILLAVFKVLLHRYTGQGDIIVGTPIANRNRAEIEGLIGFFVNTLVLRTDLSGDPTFREVLGRVRDVCLGAYAHQDVPFDKLVEEMQPERNLSYSPLIQVMFVFQNESPVIPKLSGLGVSSIQVDTGTSKFDLSLVVQEGENGLGVTVEYNTDLFDAAAITRMLGHLEVLVGGIVSDPDRSLGELPLLTEAERHQVLVEWNATQAEYPKDVCIHQLFEAQVERTPDAIAVVFEDQQVTYGQLNTRANQLAHYLRKRGVGPEVLVGICVERSVEMVIAVLGILKAGGAYVPLDPTYPEERLAHMLEDAQMSVLLTQHHLVEGLPEARAVVVCLDTDHQTIATEKGENLVNRASATNLVYVIYTSGSTGKPKGVLIEHGGLCNVSLASIKNFGLQADNCIMLQHGSFGFDNSVWEIFMALLAGATLCIAGSDALVGSGLAQLLRDQGITTAILVPSVLATVPCEDYPDLQTLLVGAESCPPELVNRWSPGRRFFNTYGPTEATIHVSLMECGEDYTKQPPIGRPTANTQIYLLDRYMKPVPLGIPGELNIGGVGLARGYLNNPDLTGEKFPPNPFSDEPGARLFKTGDLGRYLPDGNIEFLGRLDDQVKIRGFRIELGEIEAVLGQHSAVEKVVVLAPEEVSGERRLVAYVVPKQGVALSVNTLRNFLSDKIPNYMIPSVFMFLDALPLLSSGKIDRRALPAPDQTRPELEEDFVAPRTPTEEILAGIWSEILGLEKVGIHDKFFELGGYSLLVTQVVSRVRDAFQVELPLRRIFEAATVADQALLVEKLIVTDIQGLSDEEALELLK